MRQRGGGSQAFGHRAGLAGVPYQSQIKQLMREWVLGDRDEPRD